MDLLLKGKDDRYLEAAKMGRLFVPYDESGWPIERRVGRHLAAIKEIVAAYNELHPRAPVIIEGVPTYDDLVKNGLGAYLNPPPK
jgi:hypothetical protein